MKHMQSKNDSISLNVQAVFHVQFHIIMKKIAHLPNHIIFNTGFVHCYTLITSDTEVFIGQKSFICLKQSQDYNLASDETLLH